MPCVHPTAPVWHSLRGRSLVVAPGAWLSSLSRSLFDLHVPTRVSAETVSYYAPREGTQIDHSYASMPVFCSDAYNGLGAFGYYGLPMIDVPGIKASAHYAGPTVDPGRRPLSAGGAVELSAEEEAAAARQVAAVIESTSRFVAQSFPHVEHTPFTSQSCLYTSTPDHDYVLDRVPTHERVVLVGGGSGHAFKMAPAIGVWPGPCTFVAHACKQALPLSMPASLVFVLTPKGAPPAPLLPAGHCAAALALGQPTPLPVERFKLERLRHVEVYDQSMHGFRR